MIIVPKKKVGDDTVGEIVGMRMERERGKVGEKSQVVLFTRRLT